MSHTVLVVDDDPAVLDVIIGMLEDLGCEVVSAQSGPDALDRLEQYKEISILITDINMPGILMSVMRMEMFSFCLSRSSASGPLWALVTSQPRSSSMPTMTSRTPGSSSTTSTVWLIARTVL